MTPPEPVPTAQLLAESVWLERLARRLVREPADAADATQETITKALARAPSGGAPLRAWLATILRNVVRQDRRRERRRTQRELRHGEATPHEAEPADALALRLELHAHLVAAVRALEEPYRTTVALRFLEDLAPPAVAARMGVPLKTVHSRLERALEHLRSRLDRDYGRREAWLAVLLPASLLPRAPLTAPAPLVPFLAMGTLWKWTAAGAALVALGFLVLRAPSTPPHTASAQGTELVTLDAPLASPPTVPPLPTGEPEREARPPERIAAAPVAPVVADAGALLIGFVRDVEQRPVAGLTVAFEPLATTLRASLPPEELPAATESDSEGRFELPQPARLCRIIASGRGYATLSGPTLTDLRPPEALVVYVGPERAYAGRTVDGAGVPLAGVELELQLAEQLAHELQPGTFAATMPVARTTSDEDGAFAFARVGGAPGSVLAARADGFTSATLALPEASSDDLVVTLERAISGAALAGHVRHADGSAAGGAYVSGGELGARCDGAGAFELPLEAVAEPARLVAVLPGHLPGELDLAGVPADERRALELVLGPAALTLAGRVEDAQGNAVVGAEVWTTDGERFGEIPTRVGELTMLLGFDLEAVIDGAERQVGGREATSDGQGQFALTSLLDRAYALYALDRRTGELAGPIQAHAGGAPVVLRFSGEPRTRVAGRVLSFAGESLAGVKVAPLRARRGPDGRTMRSRWGEPRTTDAEGRFAFEELCVEGTSLSVHAPDSPSPSSFALADEADVAALELRIPGPRYLRVVLDDPGSAEGFAIHDERDEALTVVVQLGGVHLSCESFSIQGLATDVILTDERARTLVLHRDGKESERIPLFLAAGSVNEIRP